MTTRVIALGLAALALVGCDNSPSTGGARDNDAALLQFAREALPLMQGLERCRNAYGSYPPNAEAIVGCLPRNTSLVRQGSFIKVGNWMISPDDTGVGYTMTRQLEGRGMLVRRCARQTCRWIYDPGNGKPAAEVKLTPR